MITTKFPQLIFQMQSITSLKRCVKPLVIRYKSNKDLSNEPTLENNFDTPIKYSESKAAAWKAEDARNHGRNSVAPSWQHHVIAVSLVSFMLYFFVLREENDIDRIFDRDLRFYLKEDQKLPKPKLG